MKEKLFNDITPEFFESSFLGGSNTKHLQLRIPDNLYDSLENMSERINVPVTEIVRKSILINILPFIITRTVQRNFLETAESKSFGEKLKEYYELMDFIIEEYQQVEVFRNKIIELRDYLKNFEQEFESKMAETIKPSGR